MKPIFVVTCLFGVLLHAAAAENVTFAEVLAGKAAPTQLKLKDLNRDWYHVALDNQAAAPGGVGGARAYLALMMGAAGGVGGYYTRGETVKLEGETFLIGYRLTAKPVDFAVLMRGGGQPPPPEKPTPDSTLTLGLVRIAGLDALGDIRRFDLVVELAGGDTSAEALAAAREQAAEATGLQNLLALGAAVLAYTQDGDKTLPPLRDAAATEKALAPYCKLKNAFISPDTGERYLTNPALAGRKLADIAKPGETVVFYDAKPVNNLRAVLYLDGKAERVSEAAWAALKKAAQLP
jgi:SAM-dependent methyltransferase